MKNYLILILLGIFLLSCGSPRGIGGSRSKRSAPSGKYRNPTLFSTVNPFQGRAKAQLNRSKRKRLKLIKRRRPQSGTFRKGRKPGRTFELKRTISRGRLKSSGSRTKSKGGGRGRKNKDLFNTRKK